MVMLCYGYARSAFFNNKIVVNSRQEVTSPFGEWHRSLLSWYKV